MITQGVFLSFLWLLESCIVDIEIHYSGAPVSSVSHPVSHMRIRLNLVYFFSSGGKGGCDYHNELR